jgi:hypothetical protein
MDDDMVMNSSMGLASHSLQVVDDVLQALLAAVSGKDEKTQRHVLEQLRRYIRAGGNLQSIRVSLDRLPSFEPEAERMGLTYYAVRDDRVDEAVILIRDSDIRLLNRIAEQLEEQGTPLYENPQKNLSELLERYPDQKLLTVRIHSGKDLEEGKYQASLLGVSYAVMQGQDRALRLVFLEEEKEKMIQLKLIDPAAEPEPLLEHTDLKQVQQLVEERKKREEEAEKTREQNQQKSEGQRPDPQKRSRRKAGRRS